MKALLILVFFLSSALADLECIDTNDSTFLNRCFLVDNRMFLHVFYDFINNWINPKLIAIVILITILMLPLFILDNIEASHVQYMLKRYGRIKIFLLNYLHRTSFVICLNIAIFCIFRQKRPCTCTSDGGQTWSIYGSFYGMPSMDTFNASILGLTLFELAPMNVIVLLAIFVIPFVAINGILLGMDSIAQALVGALFGVFFHFYSTRLPQLVVGIDMIVTIIAGLLLIPLDPNLYYTIDSPNNLFSWWLWGFSFQVFAFILIFRHLTFKSYLPLLFSLNWLSIHDFTLKTHENEFDIAVLKEPKIVGKGNTTSWDMFVMSDYGWVLASFFVMMIFNFLSYCVSHYGWFSKIIN